MKRLLIFAIFLLAASQVFAQSEAYQATYLTSIKQDSFFVDFVIRSAGETSAKLGNLTLFLNYNTEALQYVGKVGLYDGPWDFNNAQVPGSYSDVSVLNRAANKRFSINFVKADGAPEDGGLPVPVDFTRIGRVKFLILSPTIDKQMSWNTTFCGVTDWMLNDITGNWAFEEGTVVAVELVSFAANTLDGLVDLSWITGSETNNLGFSIMRSETAGGPFEKITAKLIQGKGNCEKESSYRFTDENVEVGKTYYYKLCDIDFMGRQMTHPPVTILVEAPKEYGLLQNFPNPFNPTTTIQFKVKEAGRATINIYNLTGQVVRTLIDKHYNAGKFEAVWDGKNDQGVSVPTGVYFYRLKINNFTKVKKMQLVK